MYICMYILGEVCAPIKLRMLNSLPFQPSEALVAKDPISILRKSNLYWRRLLACITIGWKAMQKNITLSADEVLIQAALKRAKSENTTLNAQFRLWLEDYASGKWQAARAMETVRELQGKLRTGGRKFTREEMNER